MGTPNISHGFIFERELSLNYIASSVGLFSELLQFTLQNQYIDLAQVAEILLLPCLSS
jgi:hypothetical protein